MKLHPHNLEVLSYIEWVAGSSESKARSGIRTELGNIALKRRLGFKID